MSTFIVTGGTGFLGRNVLPLLLARLPGAQVHVLVRPGSATRLERLAAGWDGGERIHPLIGDLTAPGLGLDTTPPPADHVLHLGAIYDMTAGDEQAATNVDGTRAVIALTEKLGATLHHVSSVAVGGDYRGTFTETDFDLGQSFPTPYHRTKFEAERLVRESGGPAWRIYRPAAVVGDSATGEMDKIDGPYYLFPAIAGLAKLPALLPVAVPNLGATNIVPVDYVARAIVELMLAPGRDGEVFHLVNPRPQPMREIYAALAAAAGAPRPVADLPAVVAAPVLRPPLRAARTARDVALRRLGIPPIILEHLTMPTTFDSTRTERALAGTGITVPRFGSYADVLWRYWQANLDPNRYRRADPAGPLVGRTVLITGGSSGIGRAAALAVAEKGATVLLIARGAEALEATVAQVREAGGSAFGYPCDITDGESVDQTIKTVLDAHGHVDMLVNNAGRSIRRGVYASTDRFHDYERTMAVNYFGAVRLILALLPQMRERRFGHVVNISTAGVQGRSPRFSAYIASKSALDGFTDTVASETLSDAITFTTIHMPLVQTPMITPSGGANVGRAISPEHAAAMVVRALIERPKRIDVPLGTLGEYGHMFAPGTTDRILHQMYLAFPDSPAAKGHSPAPQDDSAVPDRAVAVGQHRRSVTGRVVRRLARLVPGTHW
ncbi:SDR family oxidoreductase [Rhodococcus spelaei]|uniref:SDR family oxidoreductase n=1 Tax=Rhodococcus spelaei TaxID=2546320 RepID=A0A541B0U6_9NOCA|nr:SDR family oxidoreductase [Rhodococcus spelaei]TQF65944.1 SDR family oxidoreductase [Rhodococcus spelaei]